MSNIRWDLFDLAVSSAQRVVPDEDVSRDAALQALIELGDTATGALAVIRARSRAKDAARALSRRPPVYNEDMDLHAAGDSVVDQADANLRTEKLERAIGSGPAHLLRLKAAGYSNREIAEANGLSEETVRLRVSAAELARDIQSDKE